MELTAELTGLEIFECHDILTLTVTMQILLPTSLEMETDCQKISVDLTY